jgi:LmbE family N-acetylglucosaminyl deacetylase
MNNIALAIVTHPDDAEFLCAGTLALLSKKGWEIHIATMTAGDCGSKILNKAEIGEIRKKEAAYFRLNTPWTISLCWTGGPVCPL